MITPKKILTGLAAITIGLSTVSCEKQTGNETKTTYNNKTEFHLEFKPRERATNDEYFTTHNPYRGATDPANAKVTKEHFGPIGDKTVLAWEKINYNDNRFVVVAGYCEPKTHISKVKWTATMCTSIPEKEKKDITAILRKKGFEGPMNYSL